MKLFGISTNEVLRYTVSLQRSPQLEYARSRPLYSFRATAVSRLMFSSRMRPRCKSKMPPLRQSCSWRLTLSRAAPTETLSRSCEMCTSEPKSAASAQSRRARRTGSGCRTDSSIHSLCQRSVSRSSDERTSEVMIFYEVLALFIISIPQKNPLLNNLIGTGEKVIRNGQSQRLGPACIQHQFKSPALNAAQLPRTTPLQHPITTTS